jgi:hypothetical protein
MKEQLLAISDQLLLSGVTVTDEEQYDLGLSFNLEEGIKWFKAGEFMQYACRVNGMKIWVAHYTQWDHFRVAFGESPRALVECECISANEARRLIFSTLTPSPSPDGRGELFMEVRDVR